MKKIIIFTMLSILMGACTEQFEDAKMYVDNPEGLIIHVTDSNRLFSYGENVGSTRVAYSGIAASFENNDTIGIYVVQGSTVIQSNIKVIYSDGVWVPTANIKNDNNYTYYAYFPYRKTGLSSNFALTGVDNIFAAGISAWTINTDQSVAQNFKNNDLMIAKGVKTSEKEVTFSMQHKMALAVIEGNCTFSYATNPSKKYPVAHKFDTNIPLYDSEQNKYYYIMRPNTTMTIGGVGGFNAGAGRGIQKKAGNITDNYTITYSTDNGATYTTTRPDWFEGLSETREVGDVLNFCVTANNSKTTNTNLGNTTVNPSIDKLRAAAPVANYDLSTKGGTSTMTTANCYMVHAPGTYRLPLVYGNAIEKGALNEVSYNPTVSANYVADTYVRTTFPNHNGDPINAPWITKSAGGSGINKGMGIGVSTADLLWQDSQNLISAVGIDGDYLTFTVPAATITAGNALIAVKNNAGTIVWSWHIWITDEDWTNTLVTVSTGNYDYRVAPVNLGWVPGNVTRTTYKGSECIVKVTTSSGSELSFLVQQPNNITDVHTSANGLSPYYQWGRKDPFISSASGVKNNSKDKIVYNINGVETSGIAKVNNHVLANIAIRNPKSFYYSDGQTYGWEDGTYSNNWNACANGVNNKSIVLSTPMEKTVYDPCPPGFCVPTNDLWKSIKDVTTYTVNTTAGEEGTYFTTLEEKILYIPYSGYRSSGSGSIATNSVGSTGRYWSSVMMPYHSGWYLYHYTNLNTNKKDGLSIRPVAQE